jgi:hypothetical protein
LNRLSLEALCPRHASIGAGEGATSADTANLLDWTKVSIDTLVSNAGGADTMV